MSSESLLQDSTKLIAKGVTVRGRPGRLLLSDGDYDIYAIAQQLPCYLQVEQQAIVVRAADHMLSAQCCNQAALYLTLAPTQSLDGRHQVLEQSFGSGCRKEFVN